MLNFEPGRHVRGVFALFLGADFKSGLGLQNVSIFLVVFEDYTVVSGPQKSESMLDAKPGSCLG